MPQGDGTGPNGQGPMTGRRMGFCAGFNNPGFMNSGFGRGLRRAFGNGFGNGRGFGFRAGRFQQSAPQQSIPVQQFQPQVITEEQEKEYLKEELEELKKETEEVQKRLKELKK